MVEEKWVSLGRALESGVWTGSGQGLGIRRKSDGFCLGFSPSLSARPEPSLVLGCGLRGRGGGCRVGRLVLDLVKLPMAKVESLGLLAVQGTCAPAPKDC